MLRYSIICRGEMFTLLPLSSSESEEGLSSSTVSSRRLVWGRIKVTTSDVTIGDVTW